jgi:hypothetical protein
MDEYPAEILIVFFDTMVQFLDIGLLKETQELSS